MLVEAARLRDALHAVRERGFAHVPSAVSEAARAELIAATPPGCDDFSLLPADDRPAVAELASELIAMVREHAESGWGLDGLDFNEVVWERGRGQGALPDDGRYSYLVAEVTLEGHTTLSVFGGDGRKDVVESYALKPGDLTLVATPGFWPGVRPRSEVGPPCAGERLSLSLRHNAYGPGGEG